ncbi:MAG: hypothetical protein LBG82_05950 [Clostridiales Family XIII bacterium]|jgi:beta-lactamase regulating signal transducer with metallopeptidase domain|nr:hypothetical protein [Clostridiales Family XIII bacterium]
MAALDQEKLDSDIKERITAMESPEYDSGPRLDRRDLIVVIVIAAVCIGGMVWGLS